MKQNIFFQEKGAVTQLALFIVAGLIAVALLANIASSKNSIPSVVLGEGGSVASEDSENSEDEESSTTSEESSTDENSTTSTKEIGSLSEKSTLSEDSIDEVSTLSTESEPSEASVESELSVDDFETIKEFNGSMAVVSNKGRLFFLIPVDITKTLELDSYGNVVGIKQTFWSRLLELLSF